MSTTRKISMALWLLVAISGGWLLWSRFNAPVAIVAPTSDDDGRVFAQVPWEFLPEIKPFELTERSGQRFSSASLAGRPYLVTFFFVNCPTICRDLNDRIRHLNRQFRNLDVTFVSISVDPENDTPEVLRRYADEFEADAQRWLFLTGQLYQVRQVGQQQFRVIVEKEHHTEDILLVDRWGRFRDRFKWNDVAEMQRLADVLRDVAAETQPPLHRFVRTRNAMAGIPHDRLPQVPWLNEFFLTERTETVFYSRAMTGRVWIASFFFTSCPTICPQMNAFLSGVQDSVLQRDAMLVSITTDPQTDTPAVLRDYARQVAADPQGWLFLTGESNYINRVASEFFRAPASPDHHATDVFIVDRWGHVRHRIDWRVPNAAAELLDWIDRLNGEDRPVWDDPTGDSGAVRGTADVQPEGELP